MNSNNELYTKKATSRLEYQKRFQVFQSLKEECRKFLDKARDFPNGKRKVNVKRIKNLGLCIACGCSCQGEKESKEMEFHWTKKLGKIIFKEQETQTVAVTEPAQQAEEDSRSMNDLKPAENVCKGLPVIKEERYEEEEKRCVEEKCLEEVYLSQEDSQILSQSSLNDTISFAFEDEAEPEETPENFEIFEEAEIANIEIEVAFQEREQEDIDMMSFCGSIGSTNTALSKDQQDYVEVESEVEENVKPFIDSGRIGGCFKQASIGIGNGIVKEETEDIPEDVKKAALSLLRMKEEVEKEEIEDRASSECLNVNRNIEMPPTIKVSNHKPGLKRSLHSVESRKRQRLAEEYNVDLKLLEVPTEVEAKDTSVQNPIIPKKSNAKKEDIICLVCSKIFRNNSSLRQHSAFHREERPFTCAHEGGCDKAYKSKSELNRHQIVHKAIKEFECTFCKKQFLRKQYLKMHLQKHPEAILFNCKEDKCSRVYINQSELDCHILTYHLRPQNRRQWARNKVKLDLSAE